MSLTSSRVAGRFFTTSTTWEAFKTLTLYCYSNNRKVIVPDHRLSVLFAVYSKLKRQDGRHWEFLINIHSSPSRVLFREATGLPLSLPSCDAGRLLRHHPSSLLPLVREALDKQRLKHHISLTISLFQRLVNILSLNGTHHL